MERIKKITIGVILVFLLLVVVLAILWYMGGKSLVYLYQNYLTQDIPGKQYNNQDFTDRGPREMLHGYYGWADSSGFYMWTMSGLKRFVHRQDMSIYYYVDTCGLIKQLEEGSKEKSADGKNILEERMTFNLSDWTDMMKRGDYMWVKRVGEGKDKKVIDKALGNSNNTYPLTTITEQSCE